MKTGSFIWPWQSKVTGKGGEIIRSYLTLSPPAQRGSKTIGTNGDHYIVTKAKGSFEIVNIGLIVISV